MAGTDAKDAHAEAKAANARAKALRPWYRKKRFWLLGLIALIAIGSIASSGSKSKPTTSPPTSSERSATSNTTPTIKSAATSTTPEIGQVAKDGAFAFVVKSVQCGATAATAVGGSGGFGETVPLGAQECLVTMTVSNDKGTAQTYFASNQYAYDGGIQFSADTTGAIYLTGANDDTQVNPGITITAIVPFQIPSKDKITTLSLHDSAFSGGVTVRL